MCDKYLVLYYKDVIIEILKDDNEQKHFSVNINFVELSGNDPNLGNNILKDPEKSLEEWNNAVRKVQTNLILQSESEYIYKEHTHCRIYNLPLYPEWHRIKFPRNNDTNQFLQVSGTVVRMTAMKMLEHQRQYICTKCKYTMLVNAEYEMKNIITAPKKCENPEECKGTHIVPLGDLSAEYCKDYQEIKMQEHVNKLDVGSMPNSMWVTLEDDLVDSCKPGDNVTVCGLVKIRQNQFIVGKKMEIEVVMKANHIQVNNNNSSVLSITPELKNMFQAFWKTYADTPLAARDIILKSICPEIFGLFMIKLAMAIVLAGGSSFHDNSSTGVRLRAEPHLLLVGDPGTGKSQLLKFASKIIPRSVLTTGVGSTAAGLTVAAVMENGEWQLEGGALVISDGGICCIDEFNTMKEHDRTSIHEAMEQQTISVAKAGIVCKLSTRCSILAATNPKGNLDPSQPLNMNVNLASPLLSRFDLVLLLRDKVDEAWDLQLVDYIFNSLDICNSSKLTESINWTVETLQAYFAVIKKIHPVLTEDSNKILSSYYQAQRMKRYRNKSRTTVRLLDSLVRLSQGHARLMYHEEVQIVDAVTAVVLVETAMEADSSVFNLHFDLKNDFPQDPMRNYRELVEIVLKKLELTDLLKKELDSIDTKPSDRPGPSNRGNTSPVQKTESKFFDVIKEESKSGFTKLINVEKNKRIDQAPSSTSKSDVEVDRVQKNDEISENRINTEENKGTDNSDRKNKLNSKRTKSKNDDNPKKIKLKGNDIQDDLAALQCMPSVNDIFRMDDCDLADEDIDLNFQNIQDHAENLASVHKNTPDVDIINKEATVDNQRTKTTGSKTESAVNIPNDVPKEKKNLEETSDPPSQRTRTKKWFNKFRLVPKDNQSNETAEDEAVSKENLFESDNTDPFDISNDTAGEAVSKENPFESDNTDNFDISFANVKSSTQSALTTHNENEDPTRKALESKTKSLNTGQNTKKFIFKKLPNHNKEKSINKIAQSSPSSIFESQEDIDDLDLDL